MALHRWGFELGATLIRWSGPALLSISPVNAVEVNEYKMNIRANEITRKISNHHLPDISATSREEREARPGKKTLSGIDTSQREEGRPPWMNKRQLPEKKKEKRKKGINERKKVKKENSPTATPSIKEKTKQRNLSPEKITQ